MAIQSRDWRLLLQRLSSCCIAHRSFTTTYPALTMPLNVAVNLPSMLLSGNASPYFRVMP
jgi:hypothetical protein